MLFHLILIFVTSIKKQIESLILMFNNCKVNKKILNVVLVVDYQKYLIFLLEFVKKKIIRKMSKCLCAFLNEI